MPALPENDGRPQHPETAHLSNPIDQITWPKAIYLRQSPAVLYRV